MSYTNVVMLTEFEKTDDEVVVDYSDFDERAKFEVTSIKVVGGWWNSDDSITPEPKTWSGEVRG